MVSKSTEGAKSARLDYEVTAQNKTNAILRIRLDTGRHHQIRVQLANAGIPIVGDTKYNFKETMTRSGNGLLLCSYKIGFKHPKTHKKMEFEIRNPFLIWDRNAGVTNNFCVFAIKIVTVHSAVKHLLFCCVRKWFRSEQTPFVKQKLKWVSESLLERSMSEQ